MNKPISIFKYIGIVLITLAVSCQQKQNNQGRETENGKENRIADNQHHSVSLTQSQVEALGIEMGKIPRKNLVSTIEANGVLEVPPQNEAKVTAIIGANVKSIQVIEGDQVKKGQALAYIHHPDLIKLQTEYLHDWSQLKFLEKDLERKKKLFEAEVGSGQDFQKVESEYNAMESKVKGLASQLKLLGVNAQEIQKKGPVETMAISSPIAGYIKEVKIKTGQYVAPQDNMFEVVNIEHIHADLMVFEKDVFKVKKGQKVRFRVETAPGEDLMAEIYAVGKSFEQAPKAVHIHAEIENKKGLLIPGMYVKGRVLVGESQQMALPEEAVVREGEKYYVFSGEKKEGQWLFSRHEILPGIRDNGWLEVNLINPGDSSQNFVMNKAYYLLAEMKKGEGGHHH
ncbi:efflux RND transporter periplasmic adaptor subunit [Echinicola jeungdonensis]|uniref:Efflux RND transporter periplasmic adaptor subunit n=1 Tax=Echinicola jeungdonensis TaxID=709343 RepID=A0ABV5J353_9BACT|nr:efflux RND transporter periplasmic adaptor subunit [Echinicola jeungdonensis]MDN3670697.1 efflux RND transporter periplasmic adaptor subunit [Echinicola jeungdonensis]